MKKIQNKKQLYLIPGIVCILSLIVYFFFQDIVQITLGDTISVQVKIVKEQTQLYTIHAEYPTFGIWFFPLNKGIESEVTKRIAEFKTDAADNWTMRIKNAGPGESTPQYPPEPFSFSLTWTPNQLNKNYISVVMHIDAYTGGANMMEDILTFNYDAKNQKNVLLKDLFPNNDTYLQEISLYTKNNLLSQFKTGLTEDSQTLIDFIDVGTASKEENFSRFTFDDNSITFYFPKYQVAPGAYGEQTVVMRRK